MAAPHPAGESVRRGDIWWVDFDTVDSGDMRPMRPAVVVTADALNRARRTVVVVPLATGAQPRPPIVVATPSAGQGRVAVCDQARAVDKARLTRTAGQLSPLISNRSRMGCAACSSCNAFSAAQHCGYRIRYCDFRPHIRGSLFESRNRSLPSERLVAADKDQPTTERAAGAIITRMPLNPAHPRGVLDRPSNRKVGGEYVRLVAVARPLVMPPGDPPWRPRSGRREGRTSRHRV